jgi:hypothetical protein
MRPVVVAGLDLTTFGMFGSAVKSPTLAAVSR